MKILEVKLGSYVKIGTVSTQMLYANNPEYTLELRNNNSIIVKHTSGLTTVIFPSNIAYILGE